MKNLFLILAILYAPFAAAELQERQINVREACRRTVAGNFLKHYDSNVQSKAYETLLQDKLKKLKSAVKKYTKKYNKLKKQANKNEFSADLAKLRDGEYAKIKASKTSIIEYEAMITKAKADQKSSQEGIDSIRTAIKAIFVIKYLGKSRGAYPFEIKYSKSCPKYHHLCPLPRKVADKLKTLKVEGKTPEACVRYASFSNTL